jgi:hypothetical protein
MANHPEPQAAPWEGSQIIDANLRNALVGDDEFWPLRKAQYRRPLKALLAHPDGG